MDRSQEQWHPKGFLFDMDGLLLDTERAGLEVFYLKTKEFGYDYAAVERFYLSIIGGYKTQIEEKIRSFLPAHVDFKAFQDDYWIALDAYLDEHLTLRPYAREVLCELQSKGYPMAVVTSTLGERARRKLKQADLFDKFVAVVGGDEVSANKPDPAPYILAAQMIGMDPCDCAAFEDSDTGITAAVHSGAKAVQIPDMRPADKPLPALGQIVANDLRYALDLIVK